MKGMSKLCEAVVMGLYVGQNHHKVLCYHLIFFPLGDVENNGATYNRWHFRFDDTQENRADVLTLDD